MATLQQRRSSYRILFRWHGKRMTFTLGKVTSNEAEAKRSQVEYLLMRLSQKLIQLPQDCDITTFLAHDGQPPEILRTERGKPLPVKFTLAKLRDEYLKIHEQSLETSTLNCIQIHFRHLVKTYGDQYPIQELTLAELQKHVDRRSKEKYRQRLLHPGTIKKEIVSLRTAWNWGGRMGYVNGRYPSQGLRYPKTDDKPACMTHDQITRLIEAGDKSQRVWHSLFLTVSDIQEVLELLKKQNREDFLYPMACFAAYTGARRSELMRAEVSDVDIKAGVVTLRERKRVHGKRTTRRVPISSTLKEVLKQWLAQHPGGKHLFYQQGTILRSRKNHESPTPISSHEAQHHLKHALKPTKWRVLPGWHTFRHSFISACVMQGIDQRVIDSWVGHCTEEQRKRYTHLYPQVEQQAIRSVFG
jgi:integrase